MPSITHNSTFAPLPSTNRGSPVHLSYDLKSDQIVYASNKSVFLRSVSNPFKNHVKQYVGHNSLVSVAKFSPSGFYVASGDVNGKVRIWDSTNEEMITKNEFPVLSGKINDIIWDPESTRIIAVGNGKEKFGHCFTADSGNTIGEISGHTSQINAVNISVKRPFRLATVSDDSTLVFYKGPPFKFLTSVRGHHTNFINDVAFSPSDDKIASVGSDRKIVIYDAKNGDFLSTINDAHKGSIFAVDWHPTDSNKLITASADSTIKLWNVDTSELIHTWYFQDDKNSTSSSDSQQIGVIFTSKDGNRILSLSLDGTLNILSTSSSKPENSIYGHQKSITAANYDYSSNTLYTGSYDGKIISWDVKTGIATPISNHSGIPQHSNLIVSLIKSPLSSNVFSLAWDDTLKTIKSNSIINSIPTESQPKSATIIPSKSSTESHLAVLTETNLLIYLLSKSDNAPELLKSIEIPFESNTISASHSLIAIGGSKTSPNSVSLFSFPSLEVYNPPLDLQPLNSSITTLSFSPCGKLLAAGSTSGRISLYDLNPSSSATSSLITSRWAFHTAKVNSISWRKDGKYVVTASLDTNLIVYSVDTPGKNIKLLGAHKDGVSYASWTSETSIVSAGADASVKFWDVSF